MQPMEIKKHNNILAIILFSFSICSCASILISQKLVPLVVVPETIVKKVCFKKIKTFDRPESVVGPDISPEKEPHAMQTKSGYSFYEASDLIISEWKRKIPNSPSCEIMLDVTIEISNEPIKKNQVLFLLNTISIGIIPYWADEKNVLLVKLFDQNGNLNGSYSSTINYTRIQSLFLIPASPFYVGGTNELNLHTIPIHITSIARQMGFEQNQALQSSSNYR